MRLPQVSACINIVCWCEKGWLSVDNTKYVESHRVRSMNRCAEKKSFQCISIYLDKELFLFLFL